MTKVWNHPIKAIIFDVDGLLLNTEDIYADVHKELTGNPLDWEFRKQIMGKPDLVVGDMTVKKYNLTYSAEEYCKKKDKILVELYPQAKFLKGATKVLDEVFKRNIPRAVATGAIRANFELKIVHHKDYFGQFKVIQTGDDVKQGKPNPEIFLTTMQKLGFTNPENILVFEDSPTGVKCANNAGMPVVMVPDPSLPMPISIDELGAKPTVLLHSLEEFDFNQFNWEV